MRSLTMILLASCGLVSCNFKEVAPPALARELSTSGGFWYCSEFSYHPKHYINQCYIEVMVDTSRISQWDRVGCFGQFTFTQVDEGKVRRLPKDFMAIIQGHGRHWPQPIKVFAFAYFPESYEALDPKLEWYQCNLVSAADDQIVIERPLK